MAFKKDKTKHKLKEEKNEAKRAVNDSKNGAKDAKKEARDLKNAVKDASKDVKAEKKDAKKDEKKDITSSSKDVHPGRRHPAGYDAKDILRLADVALAHQCTESRKRPVHEAKIKVQQAEPAPVSRPKRPIQSARIEMQQANPIPVSRPKSTAKIDVVTKSEPIARPARPAQSAKINVQQKMEAPAKSSSKPSIVGVVTMAPPVARPAKRSTANISVKTSYTDDYDKQMAERQIRIESLPPAERREQDQWAQTKVQKTGPCPAGYDWLRVPGGYNCHGKAHWMTDELLAEGRGGYYIIKENPAMYTDMGLFAIVEKFRQIGFSPGLDAFEGPSYDNKGFILYGQNGGPGGYSGLFPAYPNTGGSPFKGDYPGPGGFTGHGSFPGSGGGYSGGGYSGRR